MTGIEVFIADGFINMVGDPTVAGFAVIAMFVLASFAIGGKTENRIVIAIPALLLGTALIPWLWIITLFVIVLMTYLFVRGLTRG